MNLSVLKQNVSKTGFSPSDTEVKMSVMSHWTGLRTALRFLLLACLLPFSLSLGVESSDSIEKVGDHTWLVQSGNDTLVANYQYNNTHKFVILDQPVVPTEARYVKLEILELFSALYLTGSLRRSHPLGMRSPDAEDSSI